MQINCQDVDLELGMREDVPVEELGGGGRERLGGTVEVAWCSC